MYDRLCQSERHINVFDGLDWATICVDGLICWIHVFPTYDPADERLTLFVTLDVVLMAHHGKNIRCGLI